MTDFWDDYDEAVQALRALVSVRPMLPQIWSTLQKRTASRLGHCRAKSTWCAC